MAFTRLLGGPSFPRSSTVAAAHKRLQMGCTQKASNAHLRYDQIESAPLLEESYSLGAGCAKGDCGQAQPVVSRVCKMCFLDRCAGCAVWSGAGEKV